MAARSYTLILAVLFVIQIVKGAFGGDLCQVQIRSSQDALPAAAKAYQTAIFNNSAATNFTVAVVGANSYAFRISFLKSALKSSFFGLRFPKSGGGRVVFSPAKAQPVILVPQSTERNSSIINVNWDLCPPFPVKQNFSVKVDDKVCQNYFTGYQTFCAVSSSACLVNISTIPPKGGPVVKTSVPCSSIKDVTPQGSSSSSSSGAGLIIGIVIVLLILAVAIIIYVVISRRKRGSTRPFHDERVALRSESQTTSIYLNPIYDTLIRPAKNDPLIQPNPIYHTLQQDPQILPNPLYASANDGNTIYQVPTSSNPVYTTNSGLPVLEPNPIYVSGNFQVPMQPNALYESSTGPQRPLTVWVDETAT